jgi:hypothetical protein
MTRVGYLPDNVETTTDAQPAAYMIFACDAPFRSKSKIKETCVQLSQADRKK